MFPCCAALLACALRQLFTSGRSPRLEVEKEHGTRCATVLLQLFQQSRVRSYLAVGASANGAFVAMCKKTGDVLLWNTTASSSSACELIYGPPIRARVLVQARLAAKSSFAPKSDHSVLGSLQCSLDCMA